MSYFSDKRHLKEEGFVLATVEECDPLGVRMM